MLITVLILIFILFFLSQQKEGFTPYTARSGFYPIPNKRRVYSRVMPERSDIPYNGMYTIRGSKQY